MNTHNRIFRRPGAPLPGVFDERLPASWMGVPPLPLVLALTGFAFVFCFFLRADEKADDKTGSH